jgi:bifunctional non-homologous end joining protein LigD
MGPRVPFQSAKLLCELLGRVLVGKHSQMATMERRKEKRGDKLYVDTGQTGRSRTIVAPYSVRAFAAARVSTPLKWTELHLALNPSAFTIHSVIDRFVAQGDPMAPLLTEIPDLPQVLQTLALWTRSLNDKDH